MRRIKEPKCPCAMRRECSKLLVRRTRQPHLTQHDGKRKKRALIRRSVIRIPIAMLIHVGGIFALVHDTKREISIAVFQSFYLGHCVLVVSATTIIAQRKMQVPCVRPATKQHILRFEVHMRCVAMVFQVSNAQHHMPPKPCPANSSAIKQLFS